MKSLLMYMLIGLSSLCSPAFAGDPPETLTSRVEGVEALQTFYGIDANYLKVPKLNLRVAVLANGFAGFGPKTHYLPKDTVLVENYEGVTGAALIADDASGRRAAQLVWALAGYPEGLEFRLFNANRPAHFQQAVKGAIEWRADIVLCLTNFETFGDFDGTGGINALVNAASRKSLWIQSAGEFRTYVHNAPVIVGDSPHGGQWVKLRNGKAWMLKMKSNADDNAVVVTLSWNAFSPGKDFKGTDKDLDLFVYEPDSFGEPGKVFKSELRQVIGAPKNEDETALATERLELSLSKREHPYWIGVKYVGGKFSAKEDALRITVTPKKKPYYDTELGKEVAPVELLEATDDGSIMVPSDNHSVVTVGSFGKLSSLGKSAGLAKPEIRLDRAEAKFSDKIGWSGPDVAAAQLTALAVLLKAREPVTARAHLLKIYREPEPGDAKPAEPERIYSRVFRLPSIVK